MNRFVESMIPQVKIARKGSNGDGIDIGLRYGLRGTAAGDWNFQLDWTHIYSYDSTPSERSDTIHVVGTYDRQFGNYAKYRGLLGVGWKYFDLDALLTARYIHKLVIKNPDGLFVTSPDLPIPSVTYFDLTVGYELPTKTKIQVGALNITDKQPPLH